MESHAADCARPAVPAARSSADATASVRPSGRGPGAAPARALHDRITPAPCVFHRCIAGRHRGVASGAGPVGVHRGAHGRARADRGACGGRFRGQEGSASGVLGSAPTISKRSRSTSDTPRLRFRRATNRSGIGPMLPSTSRLRPVSTSQRPPRAPTTARVVFLAVVTDIPRSQREVAYPSSRKRSTKSRPATYTPPLARKPKRQIERSRGRRGRSPSARPSQPRRGATELHAERSARIRRKRTGAQSHESQCTASSCATAGTLGRSTMNVDPSPARLRTEIVPPSASTTCRTIQSPSPNPP